MPLHDSIARLTWCASLCTLRNTRLNSLSSVYTPQKTAICKQPGIVSKLKDLSSDGPVVKVIANSFFFASLVYSSVKVSKSMYVFLLCMSVYFCRSLCLFVFLSIRLSVSCYSQMLYIIVKIVKCLILMEITRDNYSVKLL